MEDVGNRSGKKRGRKRKQIDGEKVEVPKVGRKRLKEMCTISKALVGRYVRKEFAGSGIYLGKIVGYETGLYRVDYEDGDCEDLDSGELRHLLVEESELTDKWLKRKTKLDNILLTKWVKGKGNPHVGVNNVENVGLAKSPVKAVENLPAFDSSHVLHNDRVDSLDSSRVLYADLANYKVKLPTLVPSENGFADNGVERPVVIALGFLSREGPAGGGVTEAVQLQPVIDGTTDTMSDSCEEDIEEDQSLEEEVPLVPCPELPHSSGNIGIPEDYIDHLLSVYSFLRSFSVQLFLYPFRLDDFVGSLICSVPNTLLDSIYVALLRALRRHFEKLSSDGSEAASKCLRAVDWSLLDSVTWPVYLIHYLMLMRHTDGTEWKGFYAHSLEREFYNLPVGRKLVILQILCDDVLDSEYLRAEIDTREVSEFGSELEVDTTAAASMHVPRKVHPRNSKISACKVQEASISRSHENNSYCNSSQSVSDALIHGVSSDVEQDANSDECLLCGMEGTLLCCDGCPASYHSRCIGVMKSFLPEGPWYCQECSINKLGPRILRGTSLKGSDTFGVDLYGQVFVGTCDHLLVLNSRSNEAACIRYYCPGDIANVLQALQTNREHISMYSGICKDIVRYWELPEDIVLLGEKCNVDDCLSKEDSKVSAQLPLNLLDADGQSVSKLTESVDNVSHATGNSSGIMIPTNSSCNTITATNHSGENVHGEAKTGLTSSFVKSEMPGEIQGTSTTVSGPFSQKITLSDLIQKEISASYTSRNLTSSESAYFLSASKNLTVQHNVKRVGPGSRQFRQENDFTYSGSSFKIQGYVNHYLHGEFAASAAANTTALSSEENHVTGAGADRRKIASALAANMALQAKAFSSAVVRFFWPYTEKKLIEVPRERCGWCLACEANVTSRKGCLLNAAASNAIKGPMKILATLRPLKTGDGRLLGIATYIIFLEESLSGLTVGPFQSASFRAQWRAQMEQANTCSEIKFLLLEFEENLRTIALSGDWVKLVDGTSADPSVIQPSASVSGLTQKRRPGRPGKRGRKPSINTEDVLVDSHDTDITWWRGGMLPVLLYQKGLLPQSLVKKAARQGGSRKMSGVYYAEGSEAGKRSRRIVWRAAVDTCRTISQLALQVRYLDLHIRWSDLTQLENSVQDVKGPETEASAFRNAYICDKQVTENEIIYCIVFEKQKHLPSRLMKSIVEVGQSEADNHKYWFPETRVPLYLIRKFEQHNAEVPSDDNKPVAVKSNPRKSMRHLKRSMSEIVKYIERKRDNIEQQYCAFCNLDVFLSDEDSVRCNTCEGLCHKKCTSSSLVFFDDGAEYVSTCKTCSNIQILNSQNTKSNGSFTSPSLLKGQNCPNRIAASSDQSSLDTRPSPSELKPSNSAHRGIRSWGLIWKKKPEDDGTEFRIKNIILKGETNVDPSAAVCHLCKVQYNPDLMYIRCDSCNNWYHAEAVELEESKIFDLVGFKCCRCRRIKSPICPYDTNMKKRTEERRVRINGPKPEGSNKKLGSVSISQPIKFENEAGVVDVSAGPSTRFNPNACAPTPTLQKKIRIKGPKPEVSDYKPEQSFLSEQIQSENAADWGPRTSETECIQYNNNNNNLSGGPVPQKLPVRRHMQREIDANGWLPNDPSNLDSTTLAPPVEENMVNLEWEVSTINGFDDSSTTTTFNYDTLTYEDMEFEPHTYFSFNELFTSNDSDPQPQPQPPPPQPQPQQPPLDGGVVESSSAAAAMDISFSLSPNNLGVNDYTFDDSDELTFQCKICCEEEPYPDLVCNFCGIWVHSRCSPWEADELADSWSCGYCRNMS